jgi:GNAT superfamily N-acetyltransferase/predicted transcriptional regulator/predicted nucleic acid-binding protein
MQPIILKSYADVSGFIDIVQSTADKNKKALGFLPKSAYHACALQGKLWIAIEPKNQIYLGYLMFGGKYPTLSIRQLFIDKDHRRQGVGKQLVHELIKYGENYSYLSISARVASDLAANSFWVKQGFKLIRQVPGGKTNDRTINIRLRELASPALFDYRYEEYSTKPEDLSYSGKPLSITPSYVIDLNVLFDVIKKRPRRQEATRIIKAGFANHVRVCVTAEFSGELERHTQNNQNDPVLEIAKTLPTLPKVDLKPLSNLRSELCPMIFPHKASIAELSDNDKSDLVHLASCIHHKVDGFVTSEKSILRSSEIIRDTYNLDILSPQDFAQSDLSDVIEDFELKAMIEDYEIQISSARESEREEIEEFLIRLGITEDQVRSIWEPGSTASSRRRICVRSDHVLIAVASWDSPASLNIHTQLYLFVNESHPAAIKVIDHLLELVSRDACPNQLRRTDLYIAPGQDHTKQTALDRGFRQNLDAKDTSPSGSLTKISYRGTVDRCSWINFAKKFKELTGLSLPEKMPTLEEFVHTGVMIESKRFKKRINVKLFDFETLLSPALFLCKDRNAIILPIRKLYADQLLSNFRIQYEMFPSKEALLYVEKAYFKHPRNAKYFHKGQPIIFYVSGRNGGHKAAVGHARLTYTEILSIEEILIKLSRQGVLSREEMSSYMDSSHRIHAITFDNFNLFNQSVKFADLKKSGLVSKANLVTAETISYKQLNLLFQMVQAKSTQ